MSMRKISFLTKSMRFLLQMVRNYRKPLIVASPKTLLRAPDCQSTLVDMGEGQRFMPVISDAQPPSQIKRVIFVSGKHFYTLRKEIEDRKINDTAVIRIEVFIYIIFEMR